jgi:hypothetical protein
VTRISSAVGWSLRSENLLTVQIDGWKVRSMTRHKVRTKHMLLIWGLISFSMLMGNYRVIRRVVSAKHLHSRRDVLVLEKTKYAC